MDERFQSVDDLIESMDLPEELKRQQIEYIKSQSNSRERLVRRIVNRIKDSEE